MNRWFVHLSIRNRVRTENEQEFFYTPPLHPPFVGNRREWKSSENDLRSDDACVRANFDVAVSLPPTYISDRISKMSCECSKFMPESTQRMYTRCMACMRCATCKRTASGGSGNSFFFRLTVSICQHSEWVYAFLFKFDKSPLYFKHLKNFFPRLGWGRFHAIVKLHFVCKRHASWMSSPEIIFGDSR